VTATPPDDPALPGENDEPLVEFTREFTRDAAEYIPDPDLRTRFFRDGVAHRIRRALPRYLVSDSDGVLVTEGGYFGVAECEMWFRIEQRGGRTVAVFYEIKRPPPLSDVEDELDA
jgi:hypothetical protein